MSGGASPMLRMQCFHCSECLTVPFRKLRSEDAAHETLLEQGWIFGVEALHDGVVAFDPLCPRHARETAKYMLDNAQSIAPSAHARLQRLFPDMFRPKG